MDNNHLTIPESSYSQGGNGAANGRRRSNSVRSQQSQRSHVSGTSSQERNSSGGFPWSETTDYTRRPSIRIRRTSLTGSIRDQNQDVPTQNTQQNGTGNTVRRNRSISDPERGGNTGPRINTQQPYMPRMSEEISSPEQAQAVRDEVLHQVPSVVHEERNSNVPEEYGNVVRPSSAAGRMGNWRSLRRARTNIAVGDERERERRDEYDANLVDLLDLVDPEVATLSTLTNVQNSLFIPDLGRLLNRRPTYNLTRPPSDIEEGSSSSSDYGGGGGEITKEPTRIRPQRTATGATLNTITSNVNDRYYAVLPHGESLSGWTEEEKLELNDHVRHMLHSKRSKFKRSMKGFRQYVKKPLGFFVTLYATLITLFGLIWVLFLIGWISIGSRHDYVVNVIDNVLVALFAIMGDGLAPFRAIDTYHMIFIAHYHHLTWRLRKERKFPKLQNKNDLPAIQPDEAQDFEFSVLSEKQQRRLAHHQKKFARSHSFYKPHETYTHYAFPLRLLVAIVVLLDCHSLLQIALGTCTWAISYHTRPFALTTVILCCSITVNITAGVLISVGDHKTRKKDVREKMMRQELTAEALKKVLKKRRGEGGRAEKEKEMEGEKLREEGLMVGKGEGEEMKDLEIVVAPPKNEVNKGSVVR